MEAKKRRDKILSELKGSSKPIVARALADKYNVSRQVIVGDIALLRAGGEDILSTPKGYVMHVVSGIQYKKKIVCQHRREQTREELQTIVNLNGEIIDVNIEHPIYGEIHGTLNISSNDDIDVFLNQITENDASLLSELTEGLHTHTIAAKNKEIVEKIESELKEKGFLYI